MIENNVYNINHHSYSVASLIIERGYERFLEIGIWQCSMMRRILESNVSEQIKEYWAVDNFNHEESGYHKRLTKEVWDGAYFQACGHMVNHLQLKVLRLKSNEACKMFSKGYFDMVFIDGSHNDAAVIEDIECWEPLIRKGGIISGHDYGNIKSVVNAVDSVYDKSRLNILPGCVWYVNL